MTKCYRRRGTVLRIAWLLGMTLLLAVSLSGCIWYRPLTLSGMKEFETKVRSKYPLSVVTCQFTYETGVTITVYRFGFDEETAYGILSQLQPIVRDEKFIQELFELFEEERPNEHNWELGYRPGIRLHLTALWNDRYQFSARSTKEGYNSGWDPDSYTWDGYTTWYGTEFVDHVPREITPEEIQQKIDRYS